MSQLPPQSSYVLKPVARLRASVLGLTASTAVSVVLLVLAAFLDGAAQGAVWCVAIALDLGGPYFFGVEGWRLAPAHFAERFGLIVIIALGESIVAIGVGVTGEVDEGIVAAAVLGTVVAAAMWWLYFDYVARIAERRLELAADRTRMARDGYTYLHAVIVAAGIVSAVGDELVIAHPGDVLPG